MKIKILYPLIIILILSCCHHADSQEGILLVQDGNSDFRIIPSANASTIEVFAGQELQGYVAQSSGAFLPMSDPYEPPLERRIFLGKSAVEKLGLILDESTLGTDGFIIKTIGDRIAIAGYTPKGTLYGVYAFLEGIGCRWLAPGVNGEVIPQKTNLVIPPLDSAQTPDILDRGFKSSFTTTFLNTDWIDWMGKNRLNLIMVESDMYGDLKRIASGEMQRRGIRAGVSFAFVNPKESTKKITDFIRTNPQVEILEIYPEDNKKNIDAMIMADSIMANNPEKKIFLRFSCDSIQNLKNAGNYEYSFEPVSRCYRHSLNDKTCEINAKQRSCLQKLIKSGRWISLYEHYMASYDQNSIPFPILQTIYSDLKYISSFDGIKSAVTQCELGNWGTYGLNYYVFSKMSWNAKYELGWIVDDYCNKFFGSASNPMKRYFSLWEDSMAKIDHISYIDPPELIVKLLDETALKSLQTCLDNAKSLSKDVMAYERIRKIQLSLDYTTLLWNTLNNYLVGIEYQEAGNKKTAKLHLQKSIENGDNLIKFLFKNVDEGIFIVTQSFIFDYIDPIINDARNRLDMING
jgi:hypothetical protein